MGRYLLFGFDMYYPSGGLNDLITAFDDAKNVNALLSDLEFELERQFYQVFDTKTGKRDGFSLYEKMQEYEDIHGDIELSDEHDIRVNMIRDFINKVIN